MAARKPPPAPKRPTRVEELRADFDRLGRLLTREGGSAAAALARERRIIGEMLEQLEKPEAVSVVDQLAEKRQSRTSDSGASSRRRKPG